MTKSFFRYDGIGPLLPFEMPTVGSVVVGLAIAAGLMAVGYFSAQKNQEAALLRRTVLVVLLLAGSYFFVELIKGLMHRPRYRALVLGYEGLEFTPWFKPFHGAKELQETYSLANDEFKSFPSGHSVQVGATAISFYGLAALYPALRRKWKLALILEVVLLVCVLPCRLVLGAHFLSDVAVGALVSVVAGIFLYARRD